MLKSYGEGQVLKVFKYDGKETVRVDLVVNNGTRWICIKARKSYRNDVPFEDQLSSSDDEYLNISWSSQIFKLINFSTS